MEDNKHEVISLHPIVSRKAERSILVRLMNRILPTRCIYCTNKLDASEKKYCKDHCTECLSTVIRAKNL